MRKLRLLEAGTKRCLLAEVEAAEGVVERFLGLMGRRKLEPSSGLLLLHCASIHTCFMLFSIDVLYLDRANVVRKIVAGMKPWRLSWCPGAASVLEAAAGWAESVGLAKGVQFEFEDTGQVG